MSTIYGYARVSTVQQNLDRQLGALRANGCLPHHIYSDKASGKSTANRPALERAINRLGTGDILLVAEWDRATRSMIDGISIIQRIDARGAFLKVLDRPHIDLTSTLGRGFIAFLSAMAQDERERIVTRAQQGRALAKARGVHLGRQPSLTAHQRHLIVERKAQGVTTRQLAADFGVHYSTIARVR
jgi:DNA invertase Pin-like site-specific DNA recombinase